MLASRDLFNEIGNTMYQGCYLTIQIILQSVANKPIHISYCSYALLKHVNNNI